MNDRQAKLFPDYEEEAYDRHCDECQISLSEPGMEWAPMLTDEAWARVARPEDCLCSECFYDRLALAGSHLMLADLRPCQFNLSRRPHSRFDQITRRLCDPPVDIKAWYEAERSLGKRSDKTGTRKL